MAVTLIISDECSPLCFIALHCDETQNTVRAVSLHCVNTKHCADSLRSPETAHPWHHWASSGNVMEPFLALRDNSVRVGHIIAPSCVSLHLHWCVLSSVSLHRLSAIIMCLMFVLSAIITARDPPRPAHPWLLRAISDNEPPTEQNFLLKNHIRQIIHFSPSIVQKPPIRDPARSH